MGQRDHFISMEMAAIGMEMMAEGGNLRHRAAARHADRPHHRALERCRPFRAGQHILSVAFKDRMPAGLIEGLASENIYVAPRLGRMRISPHVYNDEADCDRFVAALSKRLRM